MSRAEYRADVLRYDGVGAALRAIVSDVEHGLDRIHHHQTPAAQAAASTTTEEHMNIETALEDALTEVKTIGGEVLGHAKVIASTPEGAELLAVARSIVSAVVAGHVGPSTLTNVLAGLKATGELVQGYVTAAEQKQAQQAAEAQAAQ